MKLTRSQQNVLAKLKEAVDTPADKRGPYAFRIGGRGAKGTVLALAKLGLITFEEKYHTFSYSYDYECLLTPAGLEAVTGFDTTMRQAIYLAANMARNNRGTCQPVGDTGFTVSTYYSTDRFRTHRHYNLHDANGKVMVGGHTHIDTFTDIAARWMKTQEAK